MAWQAALTWRETEGGWGVSDIEQEFIRTEIVDSAYWLCLAAISQASLLWIGRMFQSAYAKTKEDGWLAGAVLALLASMCVAPLSATNAARLLRLSVGPRVVIAEERAKPKSPLHASAELDPPAPEQVH